MERYLSGVMFGVAITLILITVLLEYPVGKQCSKLGQDYNVVSYNDSTITCSNGERLAELERQDEETYRATLYRKLQEAR